jgi:hypothetical protein
MVLQKHAMIRRLKAQVLTQVFSIEALSKLYEGSIKGLLRLYAMIRRLKKQVLTQVLRLY